MCDKKLGCQLRTPYFGFRLGALGSANFDLGYFDNKTKALDGSVGGGFDAALTLRWARTESPQDDSFEGMGVNLGYMGEKTLNGFRHMPYASFELWTYDGRLTLPYIALMYTNEQYDNGLARHGGRIEVGTQWRFATEPFRGPDRVNPYLQGGIYIGGEGNVTPPMGQHSEGGLVIGVRLAIGLDFFPLF